MSGQEVNPLVVSNAFRKGIPSAAPFTDWEDFLNRGKGTYMAEMVVHRIRERFPTIYYPVTAPDYPRATVEEIVRALEELPEPELISTVFVVDHVHPYEPWLQQTDGVSIPSAMNEDDSSIQLGLGYGYWVILFRPAPDRLPQNLLFEWFQLLRMQSPWEAELYRVAVAERGPIFSEGGKVLGKDWRAEWGILGNSLFANQDDDVQTDTAVFEQCIRLPLRCAILGHAVWYIVMMSVEPDESEGSVWHRWLARARFVEFSAAHVALKLAREGIVPLPAHEKYDFLRILEDFAKPL